MKVVANSRQEGLSKYMLGYWVVESSKKDLVVNKGLK